MNIEQSLRDPNVALPIIDGPEAGGMRTWPMDSFVVVTAPIWRRSAEASTRGTACAGTAGSAWCGRARIIRVAGVMRGGLPDGNAWRCPSG